MQCWFAYSDYLLNEGELVFDSEATAKAWLVKQFKDDDDFWAENVQAARYTKFLKTTGQVIGAESFVDYLLCQDWATIECRTIVTMEDLLYYQ